VHNRQRIFKYADDTYLVLPAANSSTQCQEIEQIGVWAAQNNLKLNSRKTKEMVIRGRGKRGKSANLPAPCPGIERVSSICILGVTVNDQLSAADHVNSRLASSKSVLRVHGIPDVSLQEVFRATLLAKMTYACPAWHGMCSAGDHAKLESLVSRCWRLGYCGRDEPTLSELYSEADDCMFNGVVINPEHVGLLHQFLTEREQTYNLRRRPHGSKILLTKTQSLNEHDFLIRAM